MHLRQNNAASPPHLLPEVLQLAEAGELRKGVGRACTGAPPDVQ